MYYRDLAATPPLKILKQKLFLKFYGASDVAQARFFTARLIKNLKISNFDLI